MVKVKSLNTISRHNKLKKKTKDDSQSHSLSSSKKAKISKNELKKASTASVPSFDDFLNTLSEDEFDLDDEDGKITENYSEESSDLEFEDNRSDNEDFSDEGQEIGDKNGSVPSDVFVREHNSEESDVEHEPTPKAHKAALKNLESIDPEFFSYLKENDAELLNFDDEDEESSEEEVDDEDEENQIHKPLDNLEVASDSEAEEEALDTQSKDHQMKVSVYLNKGIVNLHVIAEWERRLSSTKDLGVLNHVIEAFECAVETVLNESETTGIKWKVEGSSNFNALMRLCIKHIKGFCVRYLCNSNNTALAEKRFDENPQDVMEKSKGKWVKLRAKIKNYMRALVVFLKSMGNPEAIAAVLRHCHKMGGLWALLTTKSYKLLRTLINIWSNGEDSCRVAAFLAIVRMANYNKEVYLNRIFKQMYIAYVANSKFTSANTWPSINFMRSSLVETYLLDTGLSYSIAFPFIRQLAIHLRNAVTAGTSEQTKQGKKEASRIVYSWQFLHSVHVWTDLLAQAVGAGDESLKLLVYPVVQICLGTIKLIPTKKYIPLRFHIIKMLITLQDKTKIFIPILPLITEVLSLTDFGGKTVGKFSVRPLDLACCLKVDATESGYYKAVSEAIFDSLLSTCKAISTELAFPEIITPTLVLLKSFIKKDCKNAEVSKKYKTLVEKMEAHSELVKKKRGKAMEDGLVSLHDIKSQQVLRVQIETSDSPLISYARDYFKSNIRVQQKAKKVSNETREERNIASKVKIAKEKEGSSKPVSYEEVFGKPLFSENPQDESGDEVKTKLDSNNDGENEIKEKKNKKAKKVKLDEKAKAKKKVKKMKKVKKILPDDVQDELVDLEFSD